MFAAPADDPRARRPADALVLILAVVTLLLGAWAYRHGTDLDQRVFEFFDRDSLPGWLSATFTVVFIFGGLYPLALMVGVLVYGQGRRAIARDMAVAAVVAVAVVTAGSALAGPEWPDIIPEILEQDGAPSYPVLRLAVAVAIVGVARPYLSVPMRKVGQRMIIPMAVAAVGLTYGNISAVIGALAVGLGAAAAIHLLFGSGVGIPSKARVMDGLAAIGLVPVAAEYVEDQPVGVTLLRAQVRDEPDLMVKVYGRDASDAAYFSRLWRWMWYRDNRRALTATGLQLVEHESLMMLEGQRAGANVPTVVKWGRSETGDALLTFHWPAGVRLAELDDADELDGEVLDRCWSALAQLHDAGLAHREIDSDRLVVTENHVYFTDLAQAVVSPDEVTRTSDIAQMLVTTALIAGPERAIDAARLTIGDDQLAAALPVLQGGALPSTLRSDVKAAAFTLDELRAALATALDTEEPELVQLARVRWSNVAMTLLTVLAAYALISSLANIGFDTIAEEVADAKWAWVVIALILAQLTNIGEWMSLTGMVVGPVPFGPTIQFRYALSFISLAVPSEAGAIAMNIRYMRKLGVTPAAAAAQGPLLTVFSKGFDIILLIVTARVVGQTIDVDDLDTGPVLRVIVLAVVLIVVGLIVTFSVPKLRAAVVPQLREAFSAVRDPLTDPERLMRIAAGTLLGRVLFALTLSASVAAYGSHIGFVEAIFVNSAVSLLVGFMPVPGGIGVGEAALTAGLTAVGVPSSAALAAAITHRMVTSYLPPVYGWYTTRWLTDRDYL